MPGLSATYKMEDVTEVVSKDLNLDHTVRLLGHSEVPLAKNVTLTEKRIIFNVVL